MGFTSGLNFLQPFLSGSLEPKSEFHCDPFSSFRETVMNEWVSQRYLAHNIIYRWCKITSPPLFELKKITKPQKN